MSNSSYLLTGLTWRPVLCISWVGIFTFLVDLDPEATPPAGSRLGSSVQGVRCSQRSTPNLPDTTNACLKIFHTEKICWGFFLKIIVFGYVTLNTSETEFMSRYTVFHTRGGSFLDHRHILRSTHRHCLRLGSDLLCQVQRP